MAILNRGLATVSIAAVLAAGCGGGGGTTEPLPGTDEAVSAVESTATDAVATAQETVNDAAAAVESSGWTDLQDNWQDSIGSIKDRWADLTEEDLLTVNGDKDQLVSLVQEKYGLDRDAAQNEVDAWASSL